MIVAGKVAVVRGSPQRVDESIQPVAEAELRRRAEPPGDAALDVEIVDRNRRRPIVLFERLVWVGRDVAVSSTTPPTAVVRVELLLNVLFDALVILVVPNSSAALVE